MKAIAILLATSTAAAAQNILPLQEQYSAPNGFSSQWTETLRTGGCKTPGQCFTIPAGARILECTGTQTVKRPDGSLELLARILAGDPNGAYEPIWTGHQIHQPTVNIRTPVFSAGDSLIVGNGRNRIWIEYQLANLGAPLTNGGGWEMQANCSVGSEGTTITVQ